MKYGISILLLFIALSLRAQVSFDSSNDSWFKTYGLPNTVIYESFKEALAGGKNTIKLNIKNDAIGRNIRKISKIPNLELAQFTDCDITQLPAEIGLLHDLFILVSKKNPISYISPEIGKCDNLMYLDLWDTRLDSLPREIQYLSNLELLRIIGNTSKDTLRFNDSTKRMARLRNLHIEDADLYRFPEFIFHCKKIESIILSNCKLDSLPEEIIYLTTLKELVLDNNKITELPYLITKMKSLEILSLRNNQLTSIPEFIVYLPNLKVLDVRDNHIPLPELDILRTLMKHRGQFYSDYERITREMEEEKKKQGQ